MSRDPSSAQSDSFASLSRRQFLAAGSASIAALLAGCRGSETDPSSPTAESGTDSPATVTTPTPNSESGPVFSRVLFEGGSINFGFTTSFEEPDTIRLVEPDGTTREKPGDPGSHSFSAVEYTPGIHRVQAIQETENGETVIDERTVDLYHDVVIEDVTSTWNMTEEEIRNRDSGGMYMGHELFLIEMRNEGTAHVNIDTSTITGESPFVTSGETIDHRLPRCHAGSSMTFQTVNGLNPNVPSAEYPQTVPVTIHIGTVQGDDIEIAAETRFEKTEGSSDGSANPVTVTVTDYSVTGARQA